jgi:hypothetical protein
MRLWNRVSRDGLLTAAGVVLALLTLTGVATSAERAPVNLDLEEGELGKTPTGWIHPVSSSFAGYKVQLTDEQPGSGKRCALISRTARGQAPAFGDYGDLTQSFDAAAYRGKRVHLRAAFRAEVSGWVNSAELWLRVDRKDGVGFYDNMGDRAITQRE